VSARPPECVGCGTVLFARDHPLYGGSVLAKGTHDCADARRIAEQTRALAAGLAEDRRMIHVRYVLPSVLGVDGWIMMISQAVADPLEFRVLSLPQGDAFVLTTHVGADVDVLAVMERVAAEAKSRSGQPMPSSLKLQWQTRGAAPQRPTAG